MRLSSSGVSTVISRSPTVNRSPIDQVTDITAGALLYDCRFVISRLHCPLFQSRWLHRNGQLSYHSQRCMKQLMLCANVGWLKILCGQSCNACLKESDVMIPMTSAGNYIHRLWYSTPCRPNPAVSDIGQVCAQQFRFAPPDNGLVSYTSPRDRIFWSNMKVEPYM